MIGIVAAMTFVVTVVAVVVYALFEVSPFAHHRDVYHLPGEHQDSPRLD
jgi:hypothetical protein